jgi:DNA invertase Pin-like site-specific DNA recombinase
MTKPRLRVALYCRVSTSNQTVENQLFELRQVAERSDWEIVANYCDEGISGTKGRTDRPQYDALIKDAYPLF